MTEGQKFLKVTSILMIIGGALAALVCLLGRNFFLYACHRRVADSGIHMAFHRKVKQLAHMLCAVVYIGRALVNRQCTRLAVLRRISFMQTLCFNIH